MADTNLVSNAVSISDPNNPANYLAPDASGGLALSAGLAKNITTATSTQVKTGAGVFMGLSVNTGGASSTATIYDGTDTSGTKLGTFSTATQVGIGLPAGGIAFTTGLFVVTATGTPADITVYYR